MENNIDPKKAQRWVELAIAILSAILGFFGGAATQSAVDIIGRL